MAMQPLIRERKSLVLASGDQKAGDYFDQWFGIAIQ